MKSILVVLVLVAVGFGAYIFFSQPDEIPNLMFKRTDGSSIDLESMREGKNELLMVFLLPRCPISEFSLGLVKGLYPRYSANVAFAGLFFGNQSAADSFRAEQEIAFPVYGIRDAADPYAVNELIETVGTSQGTRSAVYGGTVVVIDGNRKVLFALEKESIKELPDKLADLGY